MEKITKDISEENKILEKQKIESNKTQTPKFKKRINKFKKQESEFEEKIIEIKRVTIVTKGGRRFSFSALAVIGNKNGLVGCGLGKANEVPDAIKKAIVDARKNLKKVPIVQNRTVPHEQKSKFLSSIVILKPAPKGKGIIASSSVRAVVELAGYKDIYTKALGSRSKSNVVKATLKSLEKMKTIEQVAQLRGKNIEELR